MIGVLGADDPREVGRYRVLAELGRGGMGRVLLGAGPDGRLVAVKLVRAQLVEDGDFRSRFRREVAASRKVSGAYTAAVVDADANAPTPWLASVFVPGPSLSDVVAKAGPLPEDAALRLAAGLAASDVFSLGCVVFFACTGKGPFAGPSAPQTLYNVVHAEPDLAEVPEGGAGPRGAVSGEGAG